MMLEVELGFPINEMADLAKMLRKSYRFHTIQMRQRTP